MSFQPHLHNRGSRMCLEAIYPDQRIETLSCSQHHFEWALNYIYADEEAPLLPAGTILHSIGWHDNTKNNKYNPDPRNWTGFGNRSVDEMSFAWVGLYYLDDKDFKERTDARRQVLVKQQSR